MTISSIASVAERLFPGPGDSIDFDQSRCIRIDLFNWQNCRFSSGARLRRISAKWRNFLCEGGTAPLVPFESEEWPFWIEIDFLGPERRVYGSPAGVTTPTVSPMPILNARRYFFIIQWPDGQHDDPHGTDFPRAEDALKYSNRIIRELKEAGGYDDPNLRMIVKDSEGDVVHVIPF